MRKIYNAFKGCADWFIAKNLRGVPDESAYNDYFKIFEGSLENRHLHKFLHDYVPAEFAVEHMGLDLVERLNSEGMTDGTTSNSFRIPNMPIDLAIWMDDSTPLNEAAIAGLPDIPYLFAVEFINKVKDRILRTDLLSVNGLVQAITPTQKESSEEKFDLDENIRAFQATQPTK